MRLLSLALLLSTNAFTQEYVRVSPRDPQYLELSSGKPYIPIGLNLIAPPRAATPEESMKLYERWLDALSANRGNYVRFWMSNPFWDVEHASSGVYDEAKALLIERALEMCAARKIKVKLTIEHFRSIGGGRQSWADKPLHHIDNGGRAPSIADFFDGEPSRARFREKIAWLKRRFGDRPEVFGWEFWNEINAVQGGDYLAWTEAMLPVLDAAFPNNLVMQSLGSFDTQRVTTTYRKHSLMPGNDLAQVHRYLDLGAQLEKCKGPVDILAADAVTELLSYQPRRPVLLAESGAVEPKHTGPFKLYKVDKQGIILHDVLFAPFFAGAAGPGQIWHWDSYVAANNLWWHFDRFAEAVKDIDPPAEQFEPRRLATQGLRVYLLAGKRTTLAWIRDASSDWRTELEQGRTPDPVSRIRLEPGNLGKLRNLDAYDPWTGKWTKARVRSGFIELPTFTRSIVLRWKTGR
jgi:hypothetical protein